MPVLRAHPPSPRERLSIPAAHCGGEGFLLKNLLRMMKNGDGDVTPDGAERDRGDFAPGSGIFPDPGLSANLYAAGLLDAALLQVVAPAWRRHRRRSPDCPHHLWTLRYSRGGEHLKIRIHGPEAHQAGDAARGCSLAGFRAGIEEHTARWLERLGPVQDDAPRPERQDAPPLDAEDEDEPPPDRTLLWTRYRRSPVVLGPPPLCDDDRHAALLTRCLARGLELLLSQVEGGDDPAAELGFNTRHTFLLQALVPALGHLESDQRQAYLAYHRNWLIRFPLLKVSGGPDRAQGVLAQMEEKVEAMGSSTEPLRRTAIDHWDSPPAEGGEPRRDDRRGEGPRNGGGASPGDAPPFQAWSAAVAELLARGRELGETVEGRVDPYAPAITFPVLFKALHGLANQLGLNAVNEAFAHHLLLQTVWPERRVGVRILPEALEGATT